MLFVGLQLTGSILLLRFLPVSRRGTLTVVVFQSAVVCARRVNGCESRPLGQTAAVALQLRSHPCDFGAQVVYGRLQVGGLDVCIAAAGAAGISGLHC
jgi:hypothetical protein